MNPLLLGPIVIAVLWFVSLRRTPWPMFWIPFCVVNALGAAAAVAGIEAEGHTLAGLLAIAAVATLPTAIAATCTEACADEKGEISAWRARHRRRIGRGSRWRVEVRPDKESMGFYVVHGPSERFIGKADPLADMDAFMEMRVKADQAAETLNALRIEAS